MKGQATHRGRLPNDSTCDQRLLSWMHRRVVFGGLLFPDFMKRLLS